MLKLLIVEDEPYYRSTLKQEIASHTNIFSVIETAENGKIAIDIAMKLCPDIVLLDIDMPVMDGISCGEVLKEYFPACSIIYLSAYDRFDYAVGAMRLGATNYLVKPCFMQEIVDALFEEASKLQDLPAEAPSTSPEDEAPDSLKKSSICRNIEIYLQKNYAKNISLDSMAIDMGFSTAYFSKIFKIYMGQNFSDYLTNIRIETAKTLLENSQMNVKDIGTHVGYSNPNYFSKVFRKALGLSPLEYRQERQGRSDPPSDSDSSL